MDGAKREEIERRWNNRESLRKGSDRKGILNILEHGNPGYTMLKHPFTKYSDRLAPKWTPAQKRYALEDVEFLSQVVQGVLLTEGNGFIDSQVYYFPLRKTGLSAKNKPLYGTPSFYDVRATNLLGFDTTLTSDEDEPEEPSRRVSWAEYRERQAETQKFSWILSTS